MPDRKNMPDLKLRECPFCGGMDQHIEIDRRLYFDYGPLYNVVCLCGASSHKCLSEQKAIEAWNRRFGEGNKNEIN